MNPLPLAAAILVAGCSPYLYTAEVERFAGATQKFTDTISAAQAEIVTEPGEHAFWAAYADPMSRVRFSPVACRDLTGRCHLLVNGEAFEITDDALDLVRTLEAMKALGGYAAGLRAVTDAEDREAFDAAASKLSAAAATFAAVANPAAGPAVEAGVRAGTTVLGFFLDQARLAQLKASVEAVDTRMATVKPPFARGLTLLRDRRLAALRYRMATVQTPLDGQAPLPDERRERLYRQLESDAAAIAALQRSDPGATATAMVEAHAALAKALRENRIDPIAVIEAADTFAGAADAFRSAFAAQ